MVIEQHTDPATIVGVRIQHGHMIGRFTDLRHLTVDKATGLSRTGLEPGLVGSFYEEPSAVCRGGNTATYVPYGDHINILET